MTLACVREDMALGRWEHCILQAIFGDRTRGVGTGGLLTTAAKDLAGAGPNWLGR